MTTWQVVDADPKSIQQINFTGNVDWAGNTEKSFINKEVKETILELSQGPYCGCGHVTEVL